MKLEEAKEILKKHGQEHILLSYERLDEMGKEKLLQQLETIDFEKCKDLFELTKQKREVSDLKIEPLKATEASKLSLEEINWKVFR